MPPDQCSGTFWAFSRYRYRDTMTYSMKTVPITGKSYMKRMVEKVENLLRRMRWKTYFKKNELTNDATERGIDYEV